MTPARPTRHWPAALLLLTAITPPPATAEELRFDCVAEPAMTLSLGATTTGLLAEVLVERGARVTRGQVVARLDSRVQEANVAMAREQAAAREELEVQTTRLALAAAAVERSRRLAESGAGSATKLEEDEATFQIAEQELAAAEYNLRIAAMEADRQQAQLDQLSITSPIDGYVAAILLRPGEFVRQDSPVMTLAQLDPLKVEAWLPADLWGRLGPDTPATVTLPQPGGGFPARIAVIDQVFDTASGTFGLGLDLPNPDWSIPAGQRCELVLNLSDG